MQTAFCGHKGCYTLRSIVKAQYNRPMPMVQTAMVARVWLGRKHETTIVMSYGNFESVRSA